MSAPMVQHPPADDGDVLNFQSLDWAPLPSMVPTVRPDQTPMAYPLNAPASGHGPVSFDVGLNTDAYAQRGEQAMTENRSTVRTPWLNDTGIRCIRPNFFGLDRNRFAGTRELRDEIIRNK